MIGIKNIGSYVPSSAQDNISRAAHFDKPEDFVKDKIGFHKLPRIPVEECTSDMCVQAFNNLKDKADLSISEIDCLVVCTQNPDGFGLPHTSAIVQDKLDADSDIACFDISLGCSGYVYALNIVTSFMQANGMKRGLLFTADPYSKVIDPEDYITNLIFGDASTCTLLSTDPAYHSGTTIFSTNGKKHLAIAVDKKSRIISMNGQDVFNFTMKTVPHQIRSCLDKNNINIKDIDLFLLHQASKYIVDNMTKKLKISPEKVPFAATHTGNTVSSTIPLMLADYIENGPQTILLSGFGVGLSWATTILSHSKKEI